MHTDWENKEKKIYDAIHGFIYFDDIEKKVINSYPFQRLHHIYQLGIAYYVYPGATHTRFSHSIGAMEVATRIYERITAEASGDLFQYIPRKNSPEYLYWKKVLRIACLCHDLGNLPFSSIAEEDILGYLGQARWTMEIIKSDYLKKAFDKLKNDPMCHQICSHRDPVLDVVKISVGEERLSQIDKKISFTSWERMLSKIISCDFFGADRIDYLLRDAKSTGVQFGLFDYYYLIESIRIIHTENNLELGLDERGVESCEAMLLARHFMYKKVYYHPKVKACNYHLKKFLKLLYKDKKQLKNLDEYLAMTDCSVIGLLYDAARQKNEDALAIIHRSNYYKAMILPQEYTLEDVEKLKKENQIPKDKLFAEFFGCEVVKKDSFLPIVLKGGHIKKATEISQILSHFPLLVNNWIYVSPEYELLVAECLRK